eukprot:Partr_v1_DN24450_c0_g1_i3_m66329 putative Protein-l-isoaspartate O-methyltransferase
MAWNCSAKSNVDLVANLCRAEIVNSPRAVKAMLAVDRKSYCPFSPYEDKPQGLGYGATISAPHMHAYALEALEPYLQNGMHAMDVGSGSGYLTACMAQMVGSQGSVVGVEHVRELVKMSEHHVREANSELGDRIQFVESDGRRGWSHAGPYDAIHVGAASESREELQQLIDQLKSPGRMFVPVENAYGDQTVMLIDKGVDGSITKSHLMGVMYVPLTSREVQVGK